MPSSIAGLIVMSRSACSSVRSPQCIAFAASMFSRRARSSESEFIDTTTPARARTVRRDLLRDLVTFEHVLKSSDLETKLVSQIEEHQDLAGDVAMRVNVTFAFEHFDKRFELQIASRRHQVLVFRRLRAILVPLAFVITRANERVANRFFHAHACVWIAPLNAGKIRCARSFYILAERELDARHRARKNKLTRRTSIFNLHDGIQAADRIR